ncbi:hypothetical protein FAUST_10607 [Fusarium austroamericanum]|uniref:Arginase n=1 Tax=Fusarium austroamericanum TaxID=282268 RepID=A0AAN5Z0G5_FUSAU|nr:hypothetical protein FAUST_10607 [Fusarium austroamericanum]
MPDQDNKQESQKWLTFIETSIEEQQDERDIDNEAPYYEAVRDMLLHQGNSDEAISQAIERCYNHYMTSIDVENARWEEDGDKGPHKYDTTAILNSITTIVFDTVYELPYPDSKAEILSQFLIGMAKDIPPKCKQEGADPARQFDGIQMAAREAWERSHADRFTLDQERPDAEEIAHVWLNTASLIAKLVQQDQDLLAGYGSLWVSHDLEKAFETFTKGDITKHILKQAQILAVANYILIAGDAFSKVMSLTKMARNYKINAEKWKNWTSKLKEMADAVDKDARWDLKERLQKAHNKMVEMQKKSSVTPDIMTYTSITIVVCPYHVGAYDHRVGGGPLRILSHGIERDLRKLAPVSFINIGPVDEFEGEIGKTFEIIRRISNAVATAAKNNSFPLVLSGNCYGSTGTLAGLNQHSSGGARPGALWLDAHDDLDNPSIHENGYLDAMSASMMTGSSWHTLMKSVPGHEPLDVNKVIWCGLRDCSELQIKGIKEAGVDVVWGKANEKVDFTSGLAAVLDRRDDIKDAHIHLDLDVLDQSLGRVNDFPSAGGFFPEDLTGLMQMIPQKVNPTSLVVCSFDPRLEGGDTVARLACQAILQLIGALKERGTLVAKSG